MKNNEILISLKIEKENRNRLLSFLIINDISLKDLTEAIYYGLKKNSNNDAYNNSESENELSMAECFEEFENYLKTHSQFQVLYNTKNEFKLIKLCDKVKREEFIKDEKLYKKIAENAEENPLSEQSGNQDEKKIRYNYEMPIYALGIVTTSCIYVSNDKQAVLSPLFSNSASYILRDQTNLEYNISTRRLNVIEPSVIDIIAPNEMPASNKGSLKDVIIPTAISLIGMGGIRIVSGLFSSNAMMNNTMLLMTIAMPLVSGVTTFYNYNKQKREWSISKEEWKDNYENYISRVIKTIRNWQDSDIVYLNSMYPEMNKLFSNTNNIDGMIFARSQNDNDFMKISLGKSDEVKPLFEIKAEKKDNIFYDIYYRMKKNADGSLGIEIIPPETGKNKKENRNAGQISSDNKDKSLLTDLAYDFANKGKNDKGDIIGFNYLTTDKKDSNGECIKPPLLIDLNTCGALGVISTDSVISQNFIRHVVFEMSYYHSPEDIQFVFFFDKENDVNKQNEMLKNYLYLPHSNELFDGLSQFVFDKESAGEVFGKLFGIMNEREKNKKEQEENENPSDEKKTQIVCIVFNDYDIKETGFSKFLPEVPKEGEEYVNSLGLSFIFVQNRKELLPKYCGSIVNLENTERKVSMRYNVLGREQLNKLSELTGKDDSAASTDGLIEYKQFDNKYVFAPSQEINTKFETAYRQLSAIYYTRIAENGKVPSMVTLFELYNYNSAMVRENQISEKILESWNNIEGNDVTKNLAVPMGKNEHDSLYLDLHEKADGPHMLVAGTTGSGKSETIITYLIGLCMKYSPTDLNLLLVDMKGGGFSDRLGNLPHCVGAVTNTTGESEGISAVYMLKRFLESLNAEIKNRMIILSELGVDNVDAYIRAYRRIKRVHDLKSLIADEKINKEDRVKFEKEKIELESKISKNEKQAEALKKDMHDLKTMSHLVLVVDEFTELKRFSSESDDIDFIAEITTIARVGRTLGFHIILVSQNIEGAITDDIRVNSKAKICLKVATKQASKEMLGTPDAASATMPGNGRAYLLVGTGSRYEYFQSAYTGANKNMDIELPVSMAYVPNSGRINNDFYFSSKDNSRIVNKNKDVSEEDTQLKYIVNTIIELASVENGVSIPKKIFSDPLKSVIHDPEFTVQWKMSEEEKNEDYINSRKVTVGKYDIPIIQSQPDFEIDLLDSNAAIFGSSMNGKTNILKVIINTLHRKYDKDTEQLFILDFDGTLAATCNLPLVSAYFDNSNEEYVRRVFKLLDSVMNENSKSLCGKTYRNSDKSRPIHTTFIIDNLNTFINETRYSGYHEKFGRLCRDGLSKGISIIFTASDTKGISPYLLSFKQKIALNLPIDKYTELFDTRVDAAGNIPGRGYANVTVLPENITGTFQHNKPYEIQCYLADEINFDNTVYNPEKHPESDFAEKFEMITENDILSWKFKKQVQKFKTFPSELTQAEYRRLRQESDRIYQDSDKIIEVGLDYINFKPVEVNLKDSRVIAVYGKKEFGKTNLLNGILESAVNLNPESRIVFFDDGRHELENLYNKYKKSRNCVLIDRFKDVSLELNDYIVSDTYSQPVSVGTGYGIGSGLDSDMDSIFAVADTHTSDYKETEKTTQHRNPASRKLSPIQQFYWLLHNDYLDLKGNYCDIVHNIYGRNVPVENIPFGFESGKPEPTIFVIQSKSVYTNTKINLDFIHYILPELLDVAEDNNYVFIFSDVQKMTEQEVYSVFNSSVKSVFVLDNIAEFAAERGSKTVFGDMDIKYLKEEYAKCELGDGYYYDVEADDLKKVKFIKNI